MEIQITEWALDSYLNLRARRVFSPAEFGRVIRPSVELLSVYPMHPKFETSKFWSGIL